jgi:hypothetical protein
MVVETRSYTPSIATTPREKPKTKLVKEEAHPETQDSILLVDTVRKPTCNKQND